MKISLNNAKLITAALVITSLVGSFTMATILSGCIDDTEKLPKVVAGFTFTVNEDTGAVTFFNISERATKYLWSFGDQTTSTEKDPIKTYPNGTYEVSLKASNNAGASNEFKASLTVLVKDKVSLPITFDNATVNYAVTTFGGTSFAIVNNPSLTGTNNKTTKVGSITNSNNAFEGIFLNVATQIDLATKKTIAMNIRSTTPVNVLLKLEEGTSGPIEMAAAHGGTGWENLLFDFTSSAKYGRITLFIGGATPKAGTFFVDDIEQRTTLAPTAPTVAAPTPPARTATDVISIFSNAYTNISGVDYNPNWGQATVTTTIQVAGNSTLKYAGLNYQGTDFSGNAQNVAGMTSLHLDYWTANSTALNVFLISAGPVEKAKVLTVPTAGSWTSIDIPLTDFSPVALANIIQFKFDGNGDIFLDNIYFHRTGPPANAPTAAAPTPPARTATDVISIFSNAYTNISGVDYNPNWGQGTVTTTIQVAGNSTLKYAGLNYQGTDFSGNAQNVAAMSFLHLDYWTANSTALNIYAISPGPVEKAKVLTVPTNGNWTSVDIPLSDFSPVALANIIQFKFDGNGDIFLDNLYFYRTGPPATSPTVAAPTPPARTATDVISIFSNAYTNISGVDYNPNWGQSTVTTTISVAGNSTLKYAGLNYQGTDFSGNAQNVSAMGFLHVDFWTANSTALNVSIISSGPLEKAKALTVPTNGNWTSIDIPLSSFTPPVNLSNIIQFKFDGNGDIFLDNLYFYKAAGGGSGSNLLSNGNFETGTDSGWIRFQNGGTSVLDSSTPNNGAGSWSGKLATGGPSNPAFKQERFGAGTVKAGDVVQVKFDHKGTVVPPGGVFNVLLFGEGAAGASFTKVFSPAPTLAAGWTTFTATYTIAGGTDVSQGLSFLIEAVCGGDAGCSVTANIDNVSVTLNP